LIDVVYLQKFRCLTVFIQAESVFADQTLGAKFSLGYHRHSDQPPYRWMDKFVLLPFGLFGDAKFPLDSTDADRSGVTHSSFNVEIKSALSPTF
jgi:hypothetical protein